MNNRSKILLEMIQERRTVRSYSKRKVSAGLISTILKAGLWGPSAHNVQPWRFVVIRKRQSMQKIYDMMNSSSKQLLAGFNIILATTSDVVSKASVVIAVYNSCELSNRVKKFEEPYYGIALYSEIQSIAAAIQNMCLAAHSLGLGAAWLTAPLFCENDINSLLKHKGSLVALLALGYPRKFPRKVCRKDRRELVKFY